MKIPFQGETRGIMMSGDSPAPSAHGDHLYDLETVITSQPAVSDKAVQMNSTDFIAEAVDSSPKAAHHTLAIQESNPKLELADLPAIRQQAERRPAHSENANLDDDEILTLSPSDDAKAHRSEEVHVMKAGEEEIETVGDQTDSAINAKLRVNQPPQEDNSCLVNCLFYLDECCTCTIL